MTQQLYEFKQRVFEPPMKPYYDAYRGHKFMINHYHPEDENSNHVWLDCVTDSSVKVAGYVHLTDLEPV